MNNLNTYSRERHTTMQKKQIQTNNENRTGEPNETRVNKNNTTTLTTTKELIVNNNKCSGNQEQ